MVLPDSSEGNHAWLQGYDTDTDFFVWHTSSQKNDFQAACCQSYR